MNKLMRFFSVVAVGCELLAFGPVAKAVEAGDKLAEALVLTSIGSVRNADGVEVPFCTVMSRDQTKRLTLSGDQPNAEGYAIVSVNASPIARQNSVVIQKDGKRTVAEFDLMLISGDLAGKASPEAAVRLLAPTADVKDIVGFYANLLGCRVVFDVTLGGPVSVILDPAVTKEQALDVIERTLILNGYGLVDAGENLLMVTGLGKNPRSFTPIYVGVDQLPKRERFVTCILPVKHCKAVDVAQQLSQFIVPRQNGSTQCLPNEASGALIITESTSVIRNLATLLGTLDIPTPTPSAAP